MKRRILWVIPVVIAILIFSTACQKMTLDKITWTKLEGSGSYSSITQASSFKLEGKVSLVQSNIALDYLSASIDFWRYTLFAGTTAILVIDTDNYHDILGTNIFLDISGQTTNNLWINIQSNAPINGDLFYGLNPDKVILEMSITDNKGTNYITSNSAAFQFTRN